jgi:hypothetical protein
MSDPTATGVALVVKVRRNDTPVITDTDDAHDRVEWQASLGRSPSGRCSSSRSW